MRDVIAKLLIETNESLQELTGIVKSLAERIVKLEKTSHHHEPDNGIVDHD